MTKKKEDSRSIKEGCQAWNNGKKRKNKNPFRFRKHFT